MTGHWRRKMKRLVMTLLLGMFLLIPSITYSQTQQCQTLEERVALVLNQTPAAPLIELSKQDVKTFETYYNNMPPVSDVRFGRMVYLVHPANSNVIYLIAEDSNGCVIEAGQTTLDSLTKIIKGTEASL
jgi:hypothetical protein